MDERDRVYKSQNLHFSPSHVSALTASGSAGAGRCRWSEWWLVPQLPRARTLALGLGGAAVERERSNSMKKDGIRPVYW